MSFSCTVIAALSAWDRQKVPYTWRVSVHVDTLERLHSVNCGAVIESLQMSAATSVISNVAAMLADCMLHLPNHVKQCNAFPGAFPTAPKPSPA